MAQPVQTFVNRLHEAFSEKFNFKTILALVVFGMIIIVFSLSSLTGPRNGQLGPGVAATVNGEIISLKQFQDQENRVSQYYSQMLGGQFENLIQQKHLRNEALNQLVDNAVAAQSAEKEMIVATDMNIKNAILEMPYFKKDGVFQTDIYKGVLASNGLQPGDFEKMMRQQIAIQKVRDLFEASTVSTSLEKNVEVEMKNAKLNLSYLKIDSDLALKRSAISDQKAKESLSEANFKKQVDEYVKSHGPELATPGKTPSAGDLEILAAKKILANEQVVSLAKEVEAEVSKGVSVQDLNTFLGKNNLSLKETGPFDLSGESVPQINSPAVFKAALELTKEKPVSQKIIKDGDAQYLIVLKDLSFDKANPSLTPSANQLMDRQKAYAQYQGWLQLNKKAYSIDRNTALLE